MRERAVRFLDRTIFSVLLAVISLTAILSGTTDEPWWEAVVEYAVFALMLLWTVEGLLSGSWLVREHRLLVPLLVLTVFAFVQTLPLSGASVTEALAIKDGLRWTISADPYETRLFVFRLLAVVMVGGLLLRYTSNRKRLRALMYFVVGIGVASALFGIVRQVTRPDDLGFALYIPNVGPVFLSYPHPDTGYGQFVNRNHFAFLMEMTFGLALGLAANGRGHRGRQLLFIAAAAFVWTALVLTTSRGAVFSILGQLLFAALLLAGVRFPSRVSKQRESTPSWWRHAGTSLITRAALVACLMIVAAMSVVWMGGDPLVGRLESMSKEFNTEGPAEHRGRSRAEIWNATWQLIKAKPVAGSGFGAYQTAIPQYHDASGKWTPQQAHNDYLELLASGGMIGAALVAWFIFAFIRQARAPLYSTDPFRRAACFGALIGLSGVVLHSLVDFGLHITINALIFITLVVVATINGRVEKKTLPGRRPAIYPPFVA